MTSQVLLVSDDHGRERWIAAPVDGLLFTYLPHLEAFVLNEGLTWDWLGEQEMTYSPISHEIAAELVAAGQIGRIDRRRNSWLARQFDAETRRFPISEIIQAPLPRLRTEVRDATVTAVSETPGTWTAYRRYPAGRLHTAHQMASDLRRGRVKAFGKLKLEARVNESDAGYVVEVRRVV